MDQIVTTTDWKLFKERLPGWQERFMEKLIKNYSKKLSDKNLSPSDKFWKLDGKLKKDKRLTGVSCEMHKSDVVWNLIALYREGAITIEDLDGFNEKLVERVKIAVE